MTVKKFFSIFFILCVIAVIASLLETKYYEPELVVHTGGLTQKGKDLILPEYMTGYTLQVSASWATNIIIDGMTFTGSEASVTIPLYNPKKNIVITAKNPRFSTEKNYNIIRPLSEEETAQKEKEEAEKQKKIEEKKMLEKMKQEEKEKNTAEAEKIKKRYEDIAKNGYIHEIKWELHDRDFVQVDSDFEKSPDGSMQVVETFQKKEGIFTITIRLTGSYDIDTHYYRVNVTFE